MAAKSYAAALARVPEHEGGFSNHPSDPGNAAMKSITQRFYDGYRQRRGLATRSVAQITNDEMQAIYFAGNIGTRSTAMHCRPALISWCSMAPRKLRAGADGEMAPARARRSTTFARGGAHFSRR